MKTESDYNIGIEAVFVENHNLIWGISSKDTYLYRIDLQSEIMEEKISLSEETDTYRMFTDILSYKNYFIFVPGYSEHLVILNRHNWVRENIPIPYTKEWTGKGKIKFFTGIIYEDCLYLFGYSYAGIVKLDLVKREITVISKWIDNLKEKFTDGNDGCFHLQYCLVNNAVYFPFMNMNAVMEFNLIDEKITVHNVGDSSQRYISIEWDGVSFWLIPRDGSTGSIVKWNPASNDTECYMQYPDGFDYEKYAFFRTVNTGREIFLFAHRANMSIRIDFLTGEMKELPDLYDTSKISGPKYPVVELSEKTILFLINNQFIIWDLISGEKNSFAYCIDDKISERYKYEDKMQQIKKYLGKTGNGRFVKENKDIDVSSFIKYLQWSGKKA